MGLFNFASSKLAALAGLLMASIGGLFGGTPPIPDLRTQMRGGYVNARRAGRSRTPGPVRPAGSKLARMAAEGRVTLRGNSHAAYYSGKKSTVMA